MAIDAGDTAFILVSMALVNLMTPGLAFFYGGLVRSSNVLTIMMQNYVSMGLVTIIWVVWGYSLCFGTSKGSGFIGAPADHYFLEGMGEVGTIPEIVFAGFQGMFAVIAPSLMTGAFADRVRFAPYLIFIVVWVHLVYFPFCHWVWGGGWMARLGVKDFAGGIVVHTTAGFSALATVFALPNRVKLEGEEVDNTPHNIPFVALGTGLLWFGWFGFNAGSNLAANQTAALAAMNSEISASTALFFWLLLEWKMQGKPTLVGACVGAIAGLATITPAAAYVKPWAAMVIGILCVPWCYGCVELTKKYNLDDALDVWAVHGMGGLFGTLCIGIFANSDMTGGAFEAGGKLFGIQLLAVIGCAAYSFIVGYATIKVIGLFMPVVPGQEDLKLGLDVSMHGAKAYAGDNSADTSGSFGKKSSRALLNA
jgi:Amt family ammonium transporter